MNVDSQLPPTPVFTLRTDGSCRPNPGPMGIGYTLEGQGGDLLVRVGAQLGEGTNNEAEYRALIEGVRHALRHGMWNLEIVTDSNLLVQQLNGVWKVKDAGLKMLHREAALLLSLLHSWKLTHVYREENGRADTLSRQMTYEEPPLPAPSPRRAILDWQAAAVRVWWRTKTRNTYLLGRIMGISDTQVAQIGQGTSYRFATFDGMPTWHFTPAPPIKSKMLLDLLTNDTGPG